MTHPLTLTFRLIRTVPVDGKIPEPSAHDVTLPEQTFMSADSVLQTIRGVLNLNARLAQGHQALAITTGTESDPSHLRATVMLYAGQPERALYALAMLTCGRLLPQDHAISILQQFINDLDSCGGVYVLSDQSYTPKGAPDWSDLGSTAQLAEAALLAVGQPVTLRHEQFDGSLDDLLNTVD